MRDDPSIAEKSLSEQFEKLILRPLVALKRSSGLVQSLVIVIDALDECEQDDDIPVILQLIQRLRQSNAVLIKIFLTSRPELPIRLGFSKIANHDFHSFALHQVPEAVTELDISLFLKNRISKIRIDRDIPLDWPGDDAIKRLIVMSVPLFISAATICRFIEDPKWEPTMRLRELLQDEAKYATKMEKTYLPILTRLLHDQDDEDSKLLLQQFHEIVGLIILLAIPLSVNALSRLIGFRQEVISNRLDSFQSVLNIPHDPDLPVRVMHLSFRDFLVNTSSKFHVDEQQTHKNISKKCLATMSAHLRKNICNLKSYGAQRTELSTRSINHYVPPHLQYSCRYWVYHLTEGNAVVTEMHNVFIFLLKHLLHWVEAMSILGLLSETVQMINTLQSAIQTNDEIDELLHDAKRLPEVEEAWSALQQTLEGHSTSVRCVSFSLDGRIIASGSFDATIKLWNPTTGSLQHTLEGHLRCVRSVSFSPDNRVIASGSEDKTVRLWDRATGNLQRTFEGHLDSVQCIAFSPDGRFLASGSDDQTIKLWDTLTGALHRSLQGHLDSVTSVVFSPDCLLLASGSDDATIRIWDAVTGTLLHQPLEGHSAAINSVAFSPDCRLLATGSDDATTRIWDTTMGTLLQTLEGHSGCVDYVVFSPDGLRLASGSEDATVRLWDIATGILRQTLEGHSDWVTGVVFSPDGRLLVSASYDTTVRIWDTDIVFSQTTWQAHASWVESLAFSPDGQLLASGSYDNTIQLRHTETGITQQILEGHLGSVQCLRFSQDGRLLASGSEDQTIRLWDTSTGALQQISNVQGTVAGLDFSEWESHLIANMNSLVTQSCDGIDQPRSSRQDPNIGILERQWIEIDILIGYTRSGGDPSQYQIFFTAHTINVIMDNLNPLRDLIQSHPLIDHHAHNLLNRESATDYDNYPIEAITSSADGPALENARTTLPSLRAITQLSELYGHACENWNDIQSAHDQSVREDYDDLIRKSLSGTHALLLDNFLRDDEDIEPSTGHDSFTVSPTKRIVQIEALAESTILQVSNARKNGESVWNNFRQLFQDALGEALDDPNIVAFKSEISCRVGLDVDPYSSDDTTLGGSLIRILDSGTTRSGFEVNDKQICDWIVQQTLKAISFKKKAGVAKPLLFHTGLGDDRINLLRANPACLQPLIAQYASADIVLLHAGYPYTREAGYLASAYSNVYLDLGKVFPMVSREAQTKVLRESLEIAPTNRLLWSTGGQFHPEMFWLANRQFRQALETVLVDYVQQGDFTAAQAMKMAVDVLFYNSNRLYSLNLTPSYTPGE
ncbi:hypothetical protein ACN42_g4003 [Penicillium freii]|uniref:Uncharacterized protein n=1 Tax=Penicillium freii TaxID=48697 RepID=A0A101MM74_PENFR|nr:hypothetical protein ACN42_g4003 [Penicillium freii]